MQILSGVFWDSRIKSENGHELLYSGLTRISMITNKLLLNFRLT